MQLHHLRTLIFFLFVSIMIVACKSPLVIRSNTSPLQQNVFAIKNVNVIPMSPGSFVLTNVTVIIKDGKIISLDSSPVIDSAEVIDGTGKWLIPRLIDMHVHTLTDGHFNATYPTRTAAIFNTQDIMTPYVVNGVTTIFELNAQAGHFGQRNEILRGDVTGPAWRWRH